MGGGETAALRSEGRWSWKGSKGQGGSLSGMLRAYAALSMWRLHVLRRAIYADKSRVRGRDG